LHNEAALIRHNVLKALREAQEASEAAGRRGLNTRDAALLGAGVGVEQALATIKKIRFMPSSYQERHIARLMLARVQKHLLDLRHELDTETS
jgi:hypothetical protein